jgi:hypothetical protein
VAEGFAVVGVCVGSSVGIEVVGVDDDFPFFDAFDSVFDSSPAKK